MLIAAFGSPGVMTAWGFAAVRTLAREVLGSDATVLDIDGLEAFALARARQSSGEGHLVILSQYPEPELITAVLGAGARPVLFMEDLVDGVAYLATTTQQDGMSIVRAVSTSAACLAGLREHPDVLTMRRDVVGGRRIDLLVAYLSDHIGLDLSRVTLQICVQHLGQVASPNHDPPCLERAAAVIINGFVAVGLGDSTIPDEVAHLAQTLLSPLNALFMHEALPPLVWPGRVFSRTDPEAETSREESSKEIALAGGARCLVYGPYLCLPAGQWSACAVMNFGDHTQDQTFALEVVAGHIVGRLRFVPETAGLHAVRWTFETSAPQVPLEVRLLMENGAIEGSLSLVEVQLECVELPSQMQANACSTAPRPKAHVADESRPEANLFSALKKSVSRR